MLLVLLRLLLQARKSGTSFRLVREQRTFNLYVSETVLFTFSSVNVIAVCHLVKTVQRFQAT